MIGWLFCLLGILVPLARSASELDIDLNRLDQLQLALETDTPIADLFDDFKKIFHRNYSTPEETSTRKAIFVGRVGSIRRHNLEYKKGEKTFTMGINKFSDVSHDEFLDMYTVRRWERNKKMKTYALKVDGPDPILERRKREADIPDKVDWRESGFTTSIGDQGDCGSCWAFGVAGAIEAQVLINTGQLVPLSVQQLVDCDKSNMGCNGGVLMKAIDYIKDVGGLQKQSDYPYRADDIHSCRFNANKTVNGSQVKGFKLLKPRSNDDLKETLARVGPAVAAIDLSPEEYMSYAKGVFYLPSCSLIYNDLDHAVLVIGYGTEPENYWLIKNSMGTSWGERGYMRLARDRFNDCGVTRQPIVPIMGSNGASLFFVNRFLVVGVFVTVILQL